MNQLPFEKTTAKISPTPALSHLNASGEAHMVDVSGKPATVREAVAQARVILKPEIQAAIEAGNLPKGDVLATVRLAGIMAAKQTANLIPLCHPLPLHQVEIQIEPEPSGFRIVARAKTLAETGVEMEALTAATIAALTLYDMAKGLDKAIEITDIHLLHKTGGKSGDWAWESR